MFETIKIAHKNAQLAVRASGSSFMWFYYPTFFLISYALTKLKPLERKG